MNGDTTYNLGFEVNDSLGILNLQETNNVYGDKLLERDKQKYETIVNAYKKIGMLIEFLSLNFSSLRKNLFKDVNYTGRGADDVSDKDLLKTLNDEERKTVCDNFVKLNFKQLPYLDGLFEEIKWLAEKIGKEKEIEKVLKQIMETVTFDFKRSISDEKYISRAKLRANFYKLDIEGTIGGMAIILDFDYEDTIQKLEPLGIATRIAYNLQDLTDDIKKNLCTIAIEDIEEFGITEDEVNYISTFDKIWDIDNIPESIQNYIFSQIEEINIELEKHERDFSTLSIIKGGGLISNNQTKGKKNIKWKDIKNVDGFNEKALVKFLFTLRSWGVQSNTVDNLGMKMVFDSAYIAEITKTVDMFKGKLNSII